MDNDHPEIRQRALTECVRSLARIALLLGKGIGSPLIRNLIGERTASEIETEVNSIKIYSRDL